jgi:hypothetical protein
MAHRTISISLDFEQPVAALFSHLSHHENLASVFGMPIKRIQESSDPSEPNGVGSVRLLRLGPLGIQETITAFEKNRLIEYKVTKGGFMKHHLGTMRFSENAGRAHLDYTVEIESAIPGVTGPLVMSLERGMRKGLSKLQRAAR